MTLDEIWGLKFLGKSYHDECIRWAEDQLCAGIDAPSVRNLARLGVAGRPDRSKIEHFFVHALQELGESRPDRDSGLRRYALFLCHQIIDRRRDPEQAANQLADINRYECDNASIYSLWHRVVEDIHLLYRGDYAYENSDLTLKNKNSFIEKLARHFILLLNNNVPGDFLSLSVCKSCQKLVRTQYRPLSGENPLQELLIKVGLKQPKYATVCASCGSRDVTHLYSNEQRENALALLGK
ncbi:hypothetical protein [Acerihabitans sp.]|uniref:hypothetical protein n=1 Tax=Acerihabitans sp. TaxID=2811394 RepID=UPI002EDA62C9